MSQNNKRPEGERVACQVCMKEIPVSEAKSAEAVGYFLYFCGSDCYTQWTEQEKKEEKKKEVRDENRGVKHNE